MSDDRKADPNHDPWDFLTRAVQWLAATGLAWFWFVDPLGGGFPGFH